MNKIFINNPGKSTIVLMMSPTGAYYEDEYLKGISHFLEHMCFKGTKNRTTKEIAASIENIGGVLNAFTDWELTCYWALVGNSYKQIAINIIEELVINPTFPKEEINKERKVIIQELKMYEDNPAYAVDDLFNKAVFDKDSGFYLPLIGTRKSLQNIDQAELKNYYSRKYSPLTLIVIGNVKNKIELNETINGKKYTTDLIIGNKKNVFQTRKNIQQANIIIGNTVNLSNYTAPESSFILDIIHSIMEGMSGRLFTEIREKNNLCYRIRFNYSVYSNKIIKWEVSMGLEKSKITQAYDLIIKELSRPILNPELNMGVNKSIGTRERISNNPTYLAETIAYQLNNGWNYEDFIFDYKKYIKSAAIKVRDFIKDLDFKNNVMVGIVPSKDK